MAHQADEIRYHEAIEKIEKGTYRIMNAAWIWRAVHVASAGLSLLTATALSFICLHFVLSLFPWTRGAANNVRSMALAPLFALLGELTSMTPKLLVIALIVIGTRYLLRAARLAFSSIKKGQITISGFDPEWADSTYNIVRVLFIAFAVVVC